MGNYLPQNVHTAIVFKAGMYMFHLLVGLLAENRHFSSKNVQHSLVSACPVRGFADFLCFISLQAKCYWVLDCWLNKMSNFFNAFLSTVQINQLSIDESIMKKEQTYQFSAFFH